MIRCVECGSERLEVLFIGEICHDCGNTDPYGLRRQHQKKAATEVPDKINPEHYKKLKGKLEGLEVIDVIEGLSLNDNYYLGNVIKYISREKYKNGLEDLKKASWYLNRYIEFRTKAEE